MLTALQLIYPRFRIAVCKFRGYICEYIYTNVSSCLFEITKKRRQQHEKHKEVTIEELKEEQKGLNNATVDGHIYIIMFSVCLSVCLSTLFHEIKDNKRSERSEDRVF